MPFIADTPEAHDVVMAQQTVQVAFALARSCTMAYISLGGLRQNSLLRQQGMISTQELEELHQLGAVGDTNGLFLDAQGQAVDHPLNRRTIGLGLDDLRRIPTAALVAGMAKLDPARGFLNSGIARGLIIDGDTALALAG